MQIIKSIPPLREALRHWRGEGHSVALVPTMGNLHEGHIELVRRAQSLADKVVASVFVNPAQFGPGEDFTAYPRTPEEDADKLRSTGAELLFMPEAAEIYPPGSATFVEVPGLSDLLCGHSRPGHFRGVATVVCKLFNLIQPDVALFGEKDYQQLAVVRRMAADLNLPVRIVGVPTVREPSGLALSSRNGYLSAAEQALAPLLYQSLLAAQAALQAGGRDFAAIAAEQTEKLRAAGFKPDYFAIRRPDLGEPEAGDGEFAILAAAWLGRARLIDNVQAQAGQ